MLRLVPLALLLLAGCARPDAQDAPQTDVPGAIDEHLPVRHRADRTYALVNRDEPRVDTLEVAPRARALRLADGRDQHRAGGVVDERPERERRLDRHDGHGRHDGVWQTPAPAAGTWRVGVTPAVATGGVNVHGETR